VASPQEIETIREAITNSGFLIVTPGIRSTNNPLDDQRRTLTAAEAVASGADYLVIGRPILTADSPADRARQFVEEIESALPASD
jgi:orotidine-5'-phosphate decarboxylase